MWFLFWKQRLESEWDVNNVPFLTRYLVSCVQREVCYGQNAKEGIQGGVLGSKPKKERRN